MDIDTPQNIIINVDSYYREARTDFIQYYDGNRETLINAENSVRILISQILKHEGVAVSKIISRVKDRDECIKKFDRKYRDGCEKSAKKYQIRNHISDLIGFRVVCYYESDIARVKEAIDKHLRVVGETNKLQFSNPNQFGYKGLHLDFKIDDTRATIIEYFSFTDLTFEIQIRTIVQDAWSEIDHKLQYKKEIPDELKRRITSLAALFEMADRDFMSVRDETERLVEATKVAVRSDSTQDEPLNALNFSVIVEPHFAGFSFDHERNDHFVSEIRDFDPSISRNEFKAAIIKNIETVREYREYLIEETGAKGVNPITMIRYCLYLYKQVVFQDLVFPGYRKNLHRWLEYGSVFTNEIRSNSQGTDN